MKTFIKALSHYHPDERVTNSKFENFVETTPDWIVEHTGILERRFMADYNGPLPGLEISRRALRCLQKVSGFDPKKIGFIISASTHDDIHYPNAGNMLAEEMNLEVPVMQLKSACTSVAYAIFISQALIESNRTKEVLILNGEPFTRYVDYGDRSSSILFGDASAALLIAGDQGEFEIVDAEVGGKGLQIVQATRVSDTSHLSAEDLISGELTQGKPQINRRRNSDRKFQQDGKKVVAFVLNEIPLRVLSMLKRNGIVSGDIDHFICHQSNLVMMRRLCEALALPAEKHLYNVDLYGNTSSSGWVTVLSQHKDRMRRGSLILVSVFGAGMTWANLLLRRC